MQNQPFAPYYGKTQAAVSAAGATVVTGLPSEAKQLLLQNVGTVLCFFKVNTAGDTTNATAADLPLAPGQSRVITKDGGNCGVADGQTRASIFSTGAGSTVYITPGEGFGGV